MSNFDQTDQHSEPKSVKNKPFLEFFLTISWQESCLNLSCLVNFEKLKFLTCLEPKFLITWKSWIVLTAIWLSWSCLVLSFKILSLSWIVLSWEIPVLTHPCLEAISKQLLSWKEIQTNIGFLETWALFQVLREARFFVL